VFCFARAIASAKAIAKAIAIAMSKARAKVRAKARAMTIAGAKAIAVNVVSGTHTFSICVFDSHS